MADEAYYTSQRASRFPTQSVPTRDRFRATQYGYDDVEDDGDGDVEFDSFGRLTRAVLDAQSLMHQCR
jgi:hypothetical protein